MRIMFVGDSMTIGRAGDLTWRYRMWQHLCRSRTGPFAIVGPRRELYDPAADAPVSLDYGAPDFPERARAHLAGWGEGWFHMAPVVEDAVRAHRADLLLVSLGLIDLGFYTDAEQTAGNVHRFVDAARAAAPHVRAVFLPVIPNVRAHGEPDFAAQIERFNELLGKAVADLDAPGSELLLASVPPGWETDRDTYDGTHPNALGEHRIAGAFANAMHQAWGVGGPYRPAGPERRAAG
ncbi:GDSL-type esterase/lipase family protein [Streptomyces sp. NPDC049577]|uniref:GDSL-type esterase/lipase family protein n=1 Tax=Streptomyces sp. NPDC049577 TaxID=3155153 RepID=UPI0034490AE0